MKTTKDTRKTIAVSAELHKQLRMAAAVHDLDIQSLTNTIICEGLAPKNVKRLADQAKEGKS